MSWEWTELPSGFYRGEAQGGCITLYYRDGFWRARISHLTGSGTGRLPASIKELAPAQSYCERKVEKENWKEIGMVSDPARIGEVIEHTKKLLEECSPGRRRIGNDGSVWVAYAKALEGPQGERLLCHMNEHFPSQEDRELIATGPELLHALLLYIERLERYIATGRREPPAKAEAAKGSATFPQAATETPPRS